MKILVKDISGNEKLIEGSTRPFEAIFGSSSLQKHDVCNPLIVSLHGGPHDVSLSTFSKSLAFLASVGFSLLIVNYRGSLGFGEEALQSLPGIVGSQDVNDVLTAIDHVIDMGLANPSKITLFGNSHGGFLETHLIGQALDKFVAAAVRNLVCNLSLVVGTTDIFIGAPSAEHIADLYRWSPISHVSKLVHGGKEHSQSYLIGSLIRKKEPKSKSSTSSVTSSIPVPDQLVSDLTAKINFSKRWIRNLTKSDENFGHKESRVEVGQRGP